MGIKQSTIIVTQWRICTWNWS